MAVRRPPAEIWHETLRPIIYNRDDGRCQHCGKEVAFDSDDWHCDHIQSGLRGTNKLSNLRVLCTRCHCLRADKRHDGLRAWGIRKGIIPPDWRGLAWEG